MRRPGRAATPHTAGSEGQNGHHVRGVRRDLVLLPVVLGLGVVFLDGPIVSSPWRHRKAAAITAASTDAFHLAMFVAAGLLVVGAPVSFVGLRGSQPARAAGRVVPTEDVAWRGPRHADQLAPDPRSPAAPIALRYARDRARRPPRTRARPA